MEKEKEKKWMEEQISQKIGKIIYAAVEIIINDQIRNIEKNDWGKKLFKKWIE